MHLTSTLTFVVAILAPAAVLAAPAEEHKGWPLSRLPSGDISFHGPRPTGVPFSGFLPTGTGFPFPTGTGFPQSDGHHHHHHSGKPTDTFTKFPKPTDTFSLLPI